MSENPFGPPTPPGYSTHSTFSEHSGYSDYSGHSGFPGYPPRQGWPSWLVVVVGVVSGVALTGATCGGIALVAANDGSPSSASGSAIAPRNPGQAASPRSGQPADGTVQIDFPDGSTGTFAVPNGLHHDEADDDDGHVALAADDDSAAYLDVYTDETTASQARDLHLVAAQDASDDRHHGNTTGPITYRTVAGHQAAQYRLSRQDGSGTFDALATVVLIGNEQFSLYWSDDVDDFDAGAGQRLSAAVLASISVTGGEPGSDT